MSLGIDHNQRRIDRFSASLVVVMLATSLVWIYHYTNFQRATLPLASPEKLLNVTLTPMPLMPSEEVREDESEAVLESESVNEPSPKRAVEKPLNQPRSLEDLLQISTPDKMVSDTDQVSGERVFSTSLRQKIHTAKSQRERLARKHAANAHADIARTNVHGDLYVESENGCKFRKKRVVDNDVWYAVGCERKSTIDLKGYQSPFKTYASFE